MYISFHEKTAQLICLRERFSLVNVHVHNDCVAKLNLTLRSELNVLASVYCLLQAPRQQTCFGSPVFPDNNASQP